MLSLSKIRLQIGMDADDLSQDELLTTYLAAAQRLVASHVNRQVYWQDGERPQDPALVPETAIDATEDFELACLLLIGHWFSNREAVTEGNSRKLPLGVNALLDPHRIINL